MSAKTCKTCGALVRKPRRHRRWHKANRPIPGPMGPPGPMGLEGPAGGSSSPQYHYTESESGERLTERTLRDKKSLSADEIISLVQKFLSSRG